VWDTVRRVRCLWEGNIKESLSVSLAIGMLSQETVAFSGDTAIAHLDIQVLMIIIPRNTSQPMYAIPYIEICCLCAIGSETVLS
jgi:hypothetical protein